MGTSANCNPTLQIGSRCDQVCVLQQNLDNMSLYESSANGGEPDGEYGQDTANAVQNYQEQYNAESGHSTKLRTDGVADSATQQAIASDPILTGGSQSSGGGTLPATVTGGTSAASGGASTAGGCPAPLVSGPGGLCMPQSSFASNSIAGASTLTGLALTVINYLLILAGMIAVVALVIGGFWYLTAAGNEEQSEKGRKAIMNAIIGLIVVVLAYAIVNIIVNTLTTTDILNKAGQ